MNTEKQFDRRFRYGSAALGITALVLVLVLLVNAAATLIFSGNLWFIDMTSESMYSLTQGSEKMLKDIFEEVNGTREEPVKVSVIFCADPDLLCRNEQMRYVYYTALQLEKSFPDTIGVEIRDVWSNPSSVDAFRVNSYSSIYQNHVIIASGSEFRVCPVRSFYTYDSDTATTPWAFNAEKTFVKSIIAVTRAEAPICCLTVNHGEPFATEEGRAEYALFLQTIRGAGYEVQYLDLENDEIPADCRLIITFDPQTDYVSAFGQSGTKESETTRLDRFLDNAYAFLVMTDADTPELPNLEGYLEEWGISYHRYETETGQTANYLLADRENGLTQAGTAFAGQYVEGGLGASVTGEMREASTPRVVFGNAVPIYSSASYQKTYIQADEEKGEPAFSYGQYSRNSWMREIYDVFTSGPLSLAYASADGTILTDPAGEQILADTMGNYSLMTMTRENRNIGEGQGYTQVNRATYVCAIGSTDFAGSDLLGSSAYGNTDLLLSLFRLIGDEIAPVGFSFKGIYTPEMAEDAYTEAGSTRTTVALVLAPLVILTAAGVVILVRRKTRCA